MRGYERTVTGSSPVPASSYFSPWGVMRVLEVFASKRWRGLFLPMRGYEVRIILITSTAKWLFLPMRGYEEFSLQDFHATFWRYFSPWGVMRHLCFSGGFPRDGYFSPWGVMRLMQTLRHWAWRLLFLPMRGYEDKRLEVHHFNYKLFLPMRGYESVDLKRTEPLTGLFLPMRGYETDN